MTVKQLNRFQKGQAVVEYTLISLILVAALLSPMPGNPQNQSALNYLVTVIKAEYAAYKYAYSIGSMP